MLLCCVRLNGKKNQLPSLNDECQLMIDDVSNGLDLAACASIFSGCCTIKDESKL